MVKTAHDTSIVIPLKALTPGNHSFAFSVASDFFESFNNHDFRDAHIVVGIEVEKQPTWLRLEVDLAGSLVCSCDRCLGDIVTPITYHAPLMVKFCSTERDEENDGILILHPTDTQLDLTQYIYDSVCVSLPMQLIHPAGQCDPDMEEKIAALTINP